MEPLGQLFVQIVVAEPLQLGLLARIIGHFDEFDPAPFARDGDHPRRTDIVPPGQRLLGRIVQLAGRIEVVCFLKTTQRVFSAHPHLAVDHAGAEALTIEHDLRLHDRAFLRVG